MDRIAGDFAWAGWARLQDHVYSAVQDAVMRDAWVRMKDEATQKAAWRSPGRTTHRERFNGKRTIRGVLADG